jgi:hypothetical protein
MIYRYDRGEDLIARTQEHSLPYSVIYVPDLDGTVLPGMSAPSEGNTSSQASEDAKAPDASGDAKAPDDDGEDSDVDMKNLVTTKRSCPNSPDGVAEKFRRFAEEPL